MDKSRRKEDRRMFLSCTIVLLACAALSPGEDNPERDSLRGIKEIRLIVEHASSQPGLAGLIADDLRTFSELRLRRNGLRVVPQDSSLVPWLYLNVNPICQDSRAGKICAITVIVRLNQLGTDTPVTTWHQAGTLLVSSGNVNASVTEMLAKIIDLFSNDFLAANQVP
jgi:hypothetical protein